MFSYNNYIAGFERLSTEGNRYGVVYGESFAASNSGERFSYHDCVFAGNDMVFLWKTHGFDTFISNSSLDYNSVVFADDSTNSGYHAISLVQCHIEATGEVPSHDGKRGILASKMPQSTLVVADSQILHTNKYPLFDYPFDSYYHGCSITLVDNKISYTVHDEEFAQLITDNCIVGRICNNRSNYTDYQRSQAFPYNKQCNLTQYMFDESKAGSYTKSSDTKALGYSSIIMENIGDTYTVMYDDSSFPIDAAFAEFSLANTGSIGYVRLVQDNIPYDGESIIINTLSRDATTINVGLQYFDMNGQQIGSGATGNVAISTSNMFVKMPTAFMPVIPYNTKVIKMTASFGSTNAKFDVGGVFISKQ